MWQTNSIVIEEKQTIQEITCKTVECLQEITCKTVEYLQEITCITVEYLQQLFGALFGLVNNAKKCLKIVAD